jgi:hypothetical protein
LTFAVYSLSIAILFALLFKHKHKELTTENIHAG